MGRVPTGAGTAAILPSPQQGVFGRGLGVLRRPRGTMAQVAAAPRWLGMAVLPAALAAAALALLYQTEVGRLALTDQWERGALALGWPLDDAGYARLFEATRHGWAYAVATAVLAGPVLAVVVAALIYLGLGGRDGRPRFAQVFAVAAHAGVILALRQVISAPVGYVRETMASATSLGVWFPGLDEGSGLARFLGMLDLFVVWWAVVLAVGVAVLYQRRARRLAATFIGLYVGVAFLLALAMAAAGVLD